jgi:hypothetical protein
MPAENRMTWQVLAYFFITTAEILIYLTGLEFAYSQSPPDEVVRNGTLFAFHCGREPVLPRNIFMMRAEDDRLEGADYFWFFAASCSRPRSGSDFSTFYRGERTCRTKPRQSPALDGWDRRGQPTATILQFGFRIEDRE